MYQFSLAWFVELYLKTIREADQGDEEVIEEVEGSDEPTRRSATFEEKVKSRMQKLDEHFLYSLYCTTCRCIFERHKLLFALQLLMRLKENYNPDNCSESS